MRRRSLHPSLWWLFSISQQGTYLSLNLKFSKLVYTLKMYMIWISKQSSCSVGFMYVSGSSLRPDTIKHCRMTSHLDWFLTSSETIAYYGNRSSFDILDFHTLEKGSPFGLPWRIMKGQALCLPLLSSLLIAQSWSHMHLQRDSKPSPEHGLAKALCLNKSIDLDLLSYLNISLIICK